MAINILLFVVGFILLLKGSDVLTDATKDLARKFKISSFIIGVVIVGIGTSIPELVVTLFSVLGGNTQIGLGTIIGSNIFNILFILGLSAVITPLVLTQKQVWHHLPLNIFAIAVVFLVLLFNSFLNPGELGLNRIGGLILLAMFFTWIFYLYFLYIMGDGKNEEIDDSRSTPKNGTLLLLIVMGLIGILLGGEWVVDGAVRIARFFGIKETIIGLTIVGIGTSLPELSASLMAAYKKDFGIAVGNIVGSNIFDFLMILGLASAIKGISFTAPLVFDLWVAILAAVLLFAAVFIGQKYVIKRWQGAVFVLIYIIYIFYLIFIRV